MDIEKLSKETIHFATDYRKRSISDIKNSMFLKHDLDMDDYEITKLAIELEEIFNIDISDEELKDFITADDVIKCVRKKTEKK